MTREKDLMSDHGKDTINIDEPEVAPGGNEPNATNILSQCEIDCLNRLSCGNNVNQIAEQCQYSEIAIQIILSNVCKKLNARNLPHAIRISIKSGLLSA